MEVCVNKDDAAALWTYKKVGFEDTGYIDENLPDCYNLMYNLNKDDQLYSYKSDDFTIHRSSDKGNIITLIIHFFKQSIPIFNRIT